MRFPKYLILLACARLANFAQSETTNVLTPHLVNSYAEEARTNNSGLWAARSRAEAARQNVLSIPLWRDPEIMMGGMAAEQMMREEDGDLMYGVEQMLPVFGKERAARATARKETEVEEAELDYRFQMLRRDIAEAMVKAALADEVLSISREDLAWLETLAAEVGQRYASGGATQVEILRVQNERSKRVEQIRNEENRREDAYVQVNRLLNRNVNSAWAGLALPAVAKTLPEPERLTALALKFDPRLAKFRKELESAEAMVRQARKEKRPDLAVAVEGRQYARTGEGRSASVFLKMTVPWFNAGKYNAAIRREEARRTEIEHEIEDMSHATAAEVHHILTMVDNSRREALLYSDEIIPRTELALRSAEAAWNSGREGFRDVIETRRMLVEARTMRVRAVAEQQSALYELVLCCGLADLETIEDLLNPKGSKQ